MLILEEPALRHAMTDIGLSVLLASPRRIPRETTHQQDNDAQTNPEEYEQDRG